MAFRARRLGVKPVVLIVPCYNEAARLNIAAYEAGLRSLDGLRLLFVNDGSIDDTAMLLDELAQRWGQRCAVLTLEENVGKAEAVRWGMLAAFESDGSNRGLHAVGFWDADLSTPLDAVERFAEVLDKQSETVAVFGSRILLMGRHVERNAARHYAGRIFATFASLALGFPVYDTQCGAKLFRATEELRAVFHDRFMATWAFDVELLGRLAARYGADLGPRKIVVEYPLEHWSDVPGSKVRLSHLPRMMLDLGRIYRVYGSAARPVRHEGGE